jgi:hypothetical protein
MKWIKHPVTKEVMTEKEFRSMWKARIFIDKKWYIKWIK